MKITFCRYINEKFPNDDELKILTINKMNYRAFLSKCIDRLDSVWNIASPYIGNDGKYACVRMWEFN